MSYGNITENIYQEPGYIFDPPFATGPILSNKSPNILQRRDYKNEYQNYVRQDIQNKKHESSLRLKNAKIGRFGIDYEIPSDPYAQRDWKETYDLTQLSIIPQQKVTYQAPRIDNYKQVSKSMNFEPTQNITQSRRAQLNNPNAIARNKSNSQERSLSKKQYRDALIKQMNEKKKIKSYQKKMANIESDYSFFNSMGEGQPIYRGNDGSTQVDYMKSHPKPDYYPANANNKDLRHQRTEEVLYEDYNNTEALSSKENYRPHEKYQKTETLGQNQLRESYENPLTINNTNPIDNTEYRRVRNNRSRSRSNTKSPERQQQERIYREGQKQQMEDKERGKKLAKKRSLQQEYDWGFFGGLGRSQPLGVTNDGQDYIEFVNSHGTKSTNNLDKKTYMASNPNNIGQNEQRNYHQNTYDGSQDLRQNQPGTEISHNKKKTLIDSSQNIIKSPTQQNKYNYVDHYFTKGQNEYKKNKAVKAEEYYEELLEQIEAKRQIKQKGKVMERMEDLKDEQRYIKELKALEEEDFTENQRKLALAEQDRAQNEDILRLQQEADVLKRKGHNVKNIYANNEENQYDIGAEIGTENVMEDRDLQDLKNQESENNSQKMQYSQNNINEMESRQNQYIQDNYGDDKYGQQNNNQNFNDNYNDDGDLTDQEKMDLNGEKNRMYKGDDNSSIANHYYQLEKNRLMMNYGIIQEENQDLRAQVMMSEKMKNNAHEELGRLKKDIDGKQHDKFLDYQAYNDNLNSKVMETPAIGLTKFDYQSSPPRNRNVDLFSKNYGKLESESDYVKLHFDKNTEDFYANDLETTNTFQELRGESKIIPTNYKPSEAKTSKEDDDFALTDNVDSIGDVISLLQYDNPSVVKRRTIKDPNLDDFIGKQRKKDFNALMNELIEEVKEIQKTDIKKYVKDPPIEFDSYKKKYGYYDEPEIVDNEKSIKEMDKVVDELGENYFDKNESRIIDKAGETGRSHSNLQKVEKMLDGQEADGSEKDTVEAILDESEKKLRELGHDQNLGDISEIQDNGILASNDDMNDLYFSKNNDQLKKTMTTNKSSDKVIDENQEFNIEESPENENSQHLDENQNFDGEEYPENENSEYFNEQPLNDEELEAQNKSLESQNQLSQGNDYDQNNQELTDSNIIQPDSTKKSQFQEVDSQNQENTINDLTDSKNLTHQQSNQNLEEIDRERELNPDQQNSHEKGNFEEV